MFVFSDHYNNGPSKHHCTAYVIGRQQYTVAAGLNEQCLRKLAGPDVLIVNRQLQKHFPTAASTGPLWTDELLRGSQAMISLNTQRQTRKS